MTTRIRKDIKKDDTVIVLSGNYKKTVGKVLKVYPKLNKYAVEGVNKAKKHVKPTSHNEGGIIEKNLLINASNVALYHKDAKVKVATKIDDKGNKIKVNRKTGEAI